jgi:hypothetical protein
MTCRRPQPDRYAARPWAHPPAPAQIHTVITGDMPAAERDRRCLWGLHLTGVAQVSAALKATGRTGTSEP